MRFYDPIDDSAGFFAPVTWTVACISNLGSVIKEEVLAIPLISWHLMLASIACEAVLLFCRLAAQQHGRYTYDRMAKKSYSSLWLAPPARM